jgi:hypothetical protein
MNSSVILPRKTIGHSCDHEQDSEGSKAIAVGGSTSGGRFFTFGGHNFKPIIF